MPPKRSEEMGRRAGEGAHVPVLEEVAREPGAAAAFLRERASRRVEGRVSSAGTAESSGARRGAPPEVYRSGVIRRKNPIKAQDIFKTQLKPKTIRLVEKPAQRMLHSSQQRKNRYNRGFGCSHVLSCSIFFSSFSLLTLS